MQFHTFGERSFSDEAVEALMAVTASDLVKTTKSSYESVATVFRVTTTVRSDTKAPVYQITRRHIPDDHNGKVINVLTMSSLDITINKMKSTSSHTLSPPLISLLPFHLRPGLPCDLFPSSARPSVYAFLISIIRFYGPSISLCFT